MSGRGLPLVVFGGGFSCGIDVVSLGRSSRGTSGSIAVSTIILPGLPSLLT